MKRLVPNKHTDLLLHAEYRQLRTAYSMTVLRGGRVPLASASFGAIKEEKKLSLWLPLKT